MKDIDNMTDTLAEVDISNNLTTSKKDEGDSIKVFDQPSKWTSEICSAPCASLSFYIDFQIENQKSRDENHSFLNVRPFQYGMDVLNHLENVYLRMIINGYECNALTDVINSSSTTLKFFLDLQKNKEATHSDMEWIAANYETYVFYSDTKKWCFADEIFFDQKSLFIALTPFSKIALWIDGENLVCALRDLLMKVLHHVV